MVRLERLWIVVLYLLLVSLGILSILFIWPIAENGVDSLNWEFITGELQSSGRKGGVGSIIVSTLLILIVTMATAFPLGLISAYHLVEVEKRDQRKYRWMALSIDLLASTPSVVFGLFGNAVFCQFFGLGFSLLSGGLTLACMILPLVIRVTQEGMKQIDSGIWKGADALGISSGSRLIYVILPLALPSLLMGFTLALGRAIAETAALIFTSGYVTRMPESLLDSGRSLSIHIYDLSMNVPGGNTNAYGSALILVILVLLINGLASTGKNWMMKRMRITP